MGMLSILLFAVCTNKTPDDLLQCAGHKAEHTEWDTTTQST